jgi:hypothetical protein
MKILAIAASCAIIFASFGASSATAREMNVKIPNSRMDEAVNAAKNQQINKLRAILRQLGHPVGPKDPIKIEGTGGERIRFIRTEHDNEKGVKIKYWAVVWE